MKPLLSKHLSQAEQAQFRPHIIQLQKHLGIGVDGIFGNGTERSVIEFQNTVSGLDADGYVGRMTWKALENKEVAVPKSGLGKLKITDYFLEDDEYYKDVTKKDTVYIHHTAGGGNAYFVTQSWENDAKRNGGSLKVATSFIIARESKSRNPKYNCKEGEIFRAFDEKYWAHHLGLKHVDNTKLNKKSIGIEICSYGQLTKKANGNYVSMYGNIIDESEVLDLGYKWKGYQYWHKYSDKQIESLRKLLIQLKKKFNLSYQDSFDHTWFNMRDEPFQGVPGIWTHVNVRQDKFDCFPQPELLDMLNTLNK